MFLFFIYWISVSLSPQNNLTGIGGTLFIQGDASKQEKGEVSDKEEKSEKTLQSLQQLEGWVMCERQPLSLFIIRSDEKDNHLPRAQIQDEVYKITQSHIENLANHQFTGSPFRSIIELVNNGIDHGQTGGEVLVDTVEEEGYQQISVRDFGKGMGVEEIREYLLNPYSSSNNFLLSNTQESGQTGRFGMGFFSHLTLLLKDSSKYAFSEIITRKEGSPFTYRVILSKSQTEGEFIDVSVSKIPSFQENYLKKAGTQINIHLSNPVQKSKLIQKNTSSESSLETQVTKTLEEYLFFREGAVIFLNNKQINQGVEWLDRIPLGEENSSLKARVGVISSESENECSTVNYLVNGTKIDSKVLHTKGGKHIVIDLPSDFPLSPDREKIDINSSDAREYLSQIGKELFERLLLSKQWNLINLLRDQWFQWGVYEWVCQKISKYLNETEGVQVMPVMSLKDFSDINVGEMVPLHVDFLSRSYDKGLKKILSFMDLQMYVSDKLPEGQLYQVVSYGHKKIVYVHPRFWEDCAEAGHSIQVAKERGRRIKKLFVDIGCSEKSLSGSGEGGRREILEQYVYLYSSLVKVLFPHHQAFINPRADNDSDIVIYHESVQFEGQEFELLPESNYVHQVYYSNQERRESSAFWLANQEPYSDQEISMLFGTNPSEWDFSELMASHLFPLSKDEDLLTMREKVRRAKERYEAVEKEAIKAKHSLPKEKERQRVSLTRLVATIMLKCDPQARTYRGITTTGSETIWYIASKGSKLASQPVARKLEDITKRQFISVGESSSEDELPSKGELERIDMDLAIKKGAEQAEVKEGDDFAVSTLRLMIRKNSSCKTLLDIPMDSKNEKVLLSNKELIDKLENKIGFNYTDWNSMLWGVFERCVPNKFMTWCVKKSEFLSQNKRVIIDFCDQLNTPLTNNKRLQSFQQNLKGRVSILSEQMNTFMEQSIIKQMFLNMLVLHPERTLDLIENKPEFLKETLVNFAGKQNIEALLIAQTNCEALHQYYVPSLYDCAEIAGFDLSNLGLGSFLGLLSSNHPLLNIAKQRSSRPCNGKQNFQQKFIWNYIDYVEQEERVRLSSQGEKFALSILQTLSAYGMMKWEGTFIKGKKQKEVIDFVYKVAQKFEADENFIIQATEQVGPVLIAEYLLSCLPFNGKEKEFNVVDWSQFCSQEKYQKKCGDKLPVFKDIGGVILSHIFQQMKTQEETLKPPLTNKEKTVLWDVPEYNQYVSGSPDKSQRMLRVICSQSPDPFFIYKESIVNSMQAGSPEVRLSFYKSGKSKERKGKEEYIIVIDDQGEGVPEKERYVFVLPSKSYGKDKVTKGANKNFGQGMKAIWSQKGRFLNIWTRSEQTGKSSTLLFSRPHKDSSFNVYENKTEQGIPYEQEVPFSFDKKESGTRVVLNDFGDDIDMQIAVYKLKEVMGIYPFIDVYINGQLTSSPQTVLKSGEMAIVWMNKENSTIPHTELPLEGVLPEELIREGYSSLRVMRKHEAQNSTRSGVNQTPLSQEEKKKVVEKLVELQWQSAQGVPQSSPLHCNLKLTEEEKKYECLFQKNSVDTLLHSNFDLFGKYFPEVIKELGAYIVSLIALLGLTDQEESNIKAKQAIVYEVVERRAQEILGVEEIEEIADLSYFEKLKKFPKIKLDPELKRLDKQIEELNQELDDISEARKSIRKAIRVDYMQAIRKCLGEKAELLVRSMWSQKDYDEEEVKEEVKESLKEEGGRKENEVLTAVKLTIKPLANHQEVEEPKDRVAPLVNYLISLAENQEGVPPILSCFWKSLPHLNSGKETENYQFMNQVDEEKEELIQQKSKSFQPEQDSFIPSFSQIESKEMALVYSERQKQQQARVPIQASFLIEKEEDLLVVENEMESIKKENKQSKNKSSNTFSLIHRLVKKSAEIKKVYSRSA